MLMIHQLVSIGSFNKWVASSYLGFFKIGRYVHILEPKLCPSMVVDGLNPLIVRV